MIIATVQVVRTVESIESYFAVRQGNLRVKRADRLLLVVGTINAINGINLRLRERTVTQVYCGETEVASWPLAYVHGLVNAMQ